MVVQIIFVHRHGNVFVSWNAIDFSMHIVSGIASVIKFLSAIPDCLYASVLQTPL